MDEKETLSHPAVRIKSASIEEVIFEVTEKDKWTFSIKKIFNVKKFPISVIIYLPLHEILYKNSGSKKFRFKSLSSTKIFFRT